jgi:hypothetical protein
MEALVGACCIRCTDFLDRWPSFEKSTTMQGSFLRIVIGRLLDEGAERIEAWLLSNKAE